MIKLRYPGSIFGDIVPLISQFLIENCPKISHITDEPIELKFSVIDYEIEQSYRGSDLYRIESVARKLLPVRHRNWQSYMEEESRLPIRTYVLTLYVSVDLEYLVTGC